MKNKKKSKNGFGKVAQTATVLAMIAGITACTQKLNNAPVAPLTQRAADGLAQAAADARKKGDIVTANAKAAQAADAYARLGELLMLPEGIVYADDFFNQALAQDPTNRKANFYKAVTGPAMIEKGTLTKIEPMVLDSKNIESLDRAKDDIKGYKMPEVDQFAYSVPSGDKQFSSYYDVQRFERERLLPALQAGLANLVAIDTSTPLKLNFTPERMKIDPVRSETSYSYSSSYCYNDQTEGWKCQDENYNDHWSDKKLRNEYYFDKYDMKLIKAAYTAMIDQIRLATAYGLDGSDRLVPRLKAVDMLRLDQGLAGLSARDTVKVLREFPNLFVLEQDQQLGAIAASTSSAIKAGLELADMKAQLCDNPNKSRDDTNSVIHPICISIEVVDQLHTALDMLAGPKEIHFGYDAAGNDVRIVIDVSRILKTPPQDLKALLPTKFEADGSYQDWDDPTLSGIFPNGDFVAKLQQMGSMHSISDRHINQFRNELRNAKDHL